MPDISHQFSTIGESVKVQEQAFSRVMIREKSQRLLHHHNAKKYQQLPSCVPRIKCSLQCYVTTGNFYTIIKSFFQKTAEMSSAQDKKKVLASDLFQNLKFEFHQNNKLQKTYPLVNKCSLADCR